VSILSWFFTIGESKGKDKLLPKFCKDCKHFLDNEWCGRTKRLCYDLVTGEETMIYKSAQSERKWSSNTNLRKWVCGVEGKFWESK
jgi:hypothetical protein